METNNIEVLQSPAELTVGNDIENNNAVTAWMDPQADVESVVDETPVVTTEEAQAPEIGATIAEIDSVDTWVGAETGTAEPVVVEQWFDPALDADEQDSVMLDVHEGGSEDSGLQTDSAAQPAEEIAVDNLIATEEDTAVELEQNNAPAIITEKNEELGESIVVESSVEVEPESLEIIGDEPFTPTPTVPLVEMGSNVTWSTGLDGEGDFAMSGRLSVFATGTQGDTVAIGSANIPAGHEDESCTVTYNTKNNHSIGEDTQIVVTDANESVVMSGVESAAGEVISTSGIFSPSEGAIVFSGVLGSRPNNRGGISTQGDFSVVCDTPTPVVEEPIETPPVQEPVVEIPVEIPEEPVEETPEPVIELPVEEPIEEVPVNEPVVEEPVVDTTPETTVVVPSETPMEMLPNTGTETVDIGALGAVFLGLGLIAALGTRKARGLKPIFVRAR